MERALAPEGRAPHAGVFADGLLCNKEKMILKCRAEGKKRDRNKQLLHRCSDKTGVAFDNCDMNSYRLLITCGGVLMAAKKIFQGATRVECPLSAA